MKKILIIAIFIFTLIGCEQYGTCQVNYTVIYPDTTITYDTVFNYKWLPGAQYKNNRNPNVPITNSWRGSNYIELGEHDFVGTTCPIRINSYKSIKH